MDKNNFGLAKFTEQETRNYAPMMRAYNGVIGMKICCIKSDNIDLKYKEKKNANTIASLCTNIPVKKYFVESFTVLSIALDKAANGSPVINFNGQSELTFPLSPDTTDSLLNATRNSITEAITEFEATGKVKFFTDIAQCTQMAQELNDMNADAIDKFVESLMNQASSLRTLNKTMGSELDEYTKSLE